MHRIATLAAALAAFALLACQGEAHSSAWYRDHIVERDRMIDRCLVDGSETQECANAKAAYPVK